MMKTQHHSDSPLRNPGTKITGCVGFCKLHPQHLELLCLKVVEDGYEFFAKRQLVTLFSAPNYCGEFDNAGAMMSVDETLMCSFQILKVCSFIHFHRFIYFYIPGWGC